MESEAKRLLIKKIEELQNIAASQWEGREQEAVVYITRELEKTVGIGLSRETKQSTATQEGYFYVARGAAAAFKLLLPKIQDIPGPIPWMPSDARLSAHTYSYLTSLGKLSHLLRLASLEATGLSKTHVSEDKSVVEISIDTKASLVERAQTTLQKLALASEAPKSKSGELLKIENKKITRKMYSYVDCANEWFIKYDNDFELVNLYRKKAAIYGHNFLEREALPDDSIIGDRSFKEWKLICEQALGRILSHIDFAKTLKTKHPHISLENVNTLYVRKEDISDVWIEAGLKPELVKTTIEALTVTSQSITEWERDFETPCPFYIEYGKDFFLLPCFGALSNPYYALFRHLRATYTADWDRAVDRREDQFRSDLEKAFPKSHYSIPATGFKLKRKDNSTLTDIDAVIIDRHSGDIALIQLKWHDIYGRSTSQRKSRSTNILQANKWVDSVNTWVGSRTSTEIKGSLGINVNSHSNSNSRPIIYVIARYTARFGDITNQDERAVWLGWHEILFASKKLEKKNRLTNIPLFINNIQNEFTHSPTNEEFHFQDITVKLKEKS
ncbi:hypothetical protein [Ectopseudomonas mendocina]|uniref:hypothetical protein n=1 Tax=Ectopseudomonas mendocina TaxID=300 RepID=UPI00131A5474|nr:hypothetical protein [Pseudomonas mendocina]